MVGHGVAPLAKGLTGVWCRLLLSAVHTYVQHRECNAAYIAAAIGYVRDRSSGGPVGPSGREPKGVLLADFRVPSASRTALRPSESRFRGGAPDAVSWHAVDVDRMTTTSASAQRAHNLQFTNGVAKPAPVMRGPTARLFSRIGLRRDSDVAANNVSSRVWGNDRRSTVVSGKFYCRQIVTKIGNANAA
jgi:hypothetical protein